VNCELYSAELIRLVVPSFPNSFGTVLANKNRCDVVVCSVFEDGSPIEIHGQTSG
jgi:hypothetical protein